MSLLDEYEIGQREELGSFTFTQEKIIEFAEKFDPQPFHLSQEAAKDSLFGGLCASGWHTASVWMRLRVDAITRENKRRAKAGLSPVIAGPSPGIKEIRWPLPVFAGDTVTYSSSVVSARETKSRPGWAVVAHANEGVNQDGAQVFYFEGAVFIKM